MRDETVPSAIAVIGMACRYPGANDLRTFWENILARRRQFRPFPDQRFSLSDYYDPDPSAPDKTYCSKAALIDGFSFDWIAHRIPKSSFLSSDIVHWLALDVSLQALADAGFTGENVPKERSGVILGNTLTGEQTRAEGLRLRWPFVGRTLKAAARAGGLSSQSVSDLLQTMEAYYKSVFAPVTEDTLAGSLSNTIAGRICNYLDLHGGGYTVDGACSSGLIAVATAASALTNRDLDLVLAGGVDISLDTFELIGFAKAGALTQKDMHVYDRRGSGFIPGEGCGFVALKRLEDAVADGNTIYAIIRGWGISSDGKGGLMAPSVKGQAIALKRAYDRAGFHPRELDFIEGHGTGTAVGDRVELEAISSVLGEAADADNRACGITSLKSIIGHTKAASGIGGFIKAVIALNRRVLPPTANCTEPNEVFESSARFLYPITYGEVRPPTDRLKAGVSAMGFGGINCHITLESGDVPSTKLAPGVEERKLLVTHQETELFVLSAGSSADLLELARAVSRHARGACEGELGDLAAQLARDLDPGAPLRAALIAGAPERLQEGLRELEEMLGNNPLRLNKYAAGPGQDIFIGHTAQECKVGMLFPGQGSQQINMGRNLVERHEWAQELADKANEWFGEGSGRKLTEYMYKPVDKAVDRRQIDEWSALLRDTKIVQPAVCLCSLLWVEKLRRLGIRPVAVGGHSMGELTAFHVAGAFDEEALLRLALIRGETMGAPQEERGIMAALACSYDTAMDIVSRVTGYAVVANINSPKQVVLSGERSSVERAVGIAAEKGIVAHVLPVSNAFHSKFISEAAERLRNTTVIPEILGGTKTRLFSCSDGKLVEPRLKLRDHFANQTLSQVDFISLVKALARECDLMIEVGPGNVLSNLANTITNGSGHVSLPVEAQPGRDRDLNRFLGEYFVRGGKVTWEELYAGRLIRPFIPASDRTFITNPCERPFTQDIEAPTQPHHFGNDHRESNSAAVSADTKSPFSSQEIDFIRQLIRSELPGASTKAKNKPTSVIYFSPSARQEEPSAPDVRKELSPHLLLELASEISGFPKESISLTHRLLDDLNLDSIKAGQFVAKAQKRYGVNGKLDPTTMAKSSLQEIYDRIALHIPSRQEVQSVPESSDKPLKEQPLEAASLHEKADNWVRNFKVVYVKQRRTSPYSYEQIIAAASEEKRRVLIITDDGAEGLCSEMRGLLTQKGVSAASMNYKTLNSSALDDYERYDYFVFLLPQKINTNLLSKEQAYEMAARIHCIGKIITSLKMKTPKPTYAIVQFGAGDFFKSDAELSIQAKGSTAFLCSIHLENPEERIRVMEFGNANDAARILQNIMDELHVEKEFSIAAFDRRFIRRIPVLEFAETRTFKDRKINWSGKDVVLVTGGARGITAECALAFAMKTGVKLALVGSTALIDKDEEIQEVLQRYRENSITYRYYACDISEKTCVVDLKKRIEQDLGAITGVIHGAAVNKPRRAEQVILNEAVAEIAPKLLGAINICEALKDNPPKLFVGFASVIGITGMMGNAWYGFSNEILNLLLQQFESLTKTTKVISLAFSLWGEVGMGKRMGSLDALSKMGILAIPSNTGVEHFMQLVEKDPGEKQVVVASRLKGLDTLQKQAFSKPQDARFLEEILFCEKGVEIESKAVLTLEKDPYLRDHVFKGTHLLPTVFGIEAMAQAVFSVAGIRDIDYLQLENVLLSFPITVEPDNATEIRIRALVEETDTDGKEIRVKAGIRVEQTGFSKNHFEATFVLNIQKSAEQYAGNIPETFLDIMPEEDIYGLRHMLIQGKLFQRIRAIRSLDDTQGIFDSVVESSGHGSNAYSGRLVIGDPFFRDTLLQAAQIILTDLILPVEIEKWDIFLNKAEKATYTIVADLLQSGDEVIKADVVAIDTKRMIVERLKGFKSKIVERVRNAPRIDDLIAPDNWDEAEINKKLQYYCQRINRIPPEISLRHQSGIHELTRTQRHDVEKELLRKAYRKLKVTDHRLPDDITIQWTEEGRPYVKESEVVGISCCHDDRLYLCVVGRAEQGCDVEVIAHRSEEEWKELLGIMREPLLKKVARMDTSLDRAGTRIWCALEALRKATDMKESDLRYDEQIQEFLIFKSGDLCILTFPVKFLRGRERMFAIILPQIEAPLQEGLGADDIGDKMEEPNWGKFVHGGPQGQKVFAYQFPVGLRESSTITGGIYFSSYSHWLGKVRELILKPINKYIADQFYSGQFMATNYTETDISGDVRNHEFMDARAWIHKIFGANDSSLLLHFEWRKLLQNGRIMPVAFGRQQVSWVRVIGHGVVEPSACPEYFMDFLQKKDISPKGESTDIEKLPGDGKISSAELGNILHEGDLLGNNNILEESIIDTTTEHTNLAGNIYFSNYFTWQGHLRDRYLFNRSPEQYRKMNRNGQFVCVHCRVNHLREAMPFDQVLVTMKLRRLYECGIELYFEYFRVESNGEKVKLAQGDHTVAWVRVDSANNYVPQKLPAIYFKTIFNKDQEKLGQYR